MLNLCKTMNNYELKKIEDGIKKIDDYFIKINESLDKKIHIINVDMFSQLWTSTALGFGGFGGDMMIYAYTYVVKCDDNCYYIFFEGRFAYKVKMNNELYKCINDRSFPYVKDASKTLDVL